MMRNRVKKCSFFIVSLGVALTMTLQHAPPERGKPSSSGNGWGAWTQIKKLSY